MKTQLTLKHLAPYLPYGLKVQYLELDEHGMQEGGIANLQGLYCDDDIATFSDCMDYYFGQDNDVEIKPILRPLSDLTKEIEHNGEKFIPMEYILSMTSRSFAESTQQEELVTFFIKDVKIKMLAYKYVEKLFEWHFDILGLISEGLAIDLNTVK